MDAKESNQSLQPVHRHLISFVWVKLELEIHPTLKGRSLPLVSEALAREELCCLWLFMVVVVSVIVIVKVLPLSNKLPNSVY